MDRPLRPELVQVLERLVVLLDRAGQDADLTELWRSRATDASLPSTVRLDAIDRLLRRALSDQQDPRRVAAEDPDIAALYATRLTLDPNDDSGMMNNDLITYVDDARIFITADLDDFAADMAILTAAQATAGNVPGAAVEVFANGIKLGEDAASPYEFTWTDVAAGSYTLTALAIDNNNATTVSTPSSIQVVLPPNQSPVASFTADPTTGYAPLTVDLDASASSDPDGTALGYAWDFGDGATGSGAVATHTYLADGNYTVTLTVTAMLTVTETATLMATLMATLTATWMAMSTVM